MIRPIGDNDNADSPAKPAPALVGSFELLATLIRAERRALDGHSADAAASKLAVRAEHDVPDAPDGVSTLEQTVRALGTTLAAASEP